MMIVFQLPSQLSQNWLSCYWVSREVGRAQQETPSSVHKPFIEKPPVPARRVAKSLDCRQMTRLTQLFFTRLNLISSSLILSEILATGDCGGHTRLAVPLLYSKLGVTGTCQKSDSLPPRTTCHPTGAAHLQNIWPAAVEGHGGPAQTA